MQPRQLLEKRLKELSGRWEIPRDIRRISDDLGIHLIEGVGQLRELEMGGGDNRQVLNSVARSKVVEGLFIAQPEPSIYLRSKEGEGLSAVARQRFTWAHEVGHFLLWRSLGQASPGHYWHIEQDCNWFASNFLVPDEALIENIGKPSRSWLGNINLICTSCGVSWSVAANRLTAYSEGKLLFLVGRLVQPAGKSWRMEIQFSSASLYSGSSLASKAVINDFIFVERCKVLAEGSFWITQLTFDMGQVQSRNCYAMVHRWGDRIELMVRLKGLPPDPIRSSAVF